MVVVAVGVVVCRAQLTSKEADEVERVHQVYKVLSLRSNRTMPETPAEETISRNHTQISIIQRYII